MARVPRCNWFSLSVSTTGGGTARNYIVFCDQAGPTWSKYAEGTISGTYIWSSVPCERVYVMVGMAAPATDAGGQVIMVDLQS